MVSRSRFLIRDGFGAGRYAPYPNTLRYVTATHPYSVDTLHYQGIRYKAANWQWGGQTKGRGRQDTVKQAPESIKDVYVDPLANDFQSQLGLKEDASLGERALTESINGENWAEQEPLGDKRLSQRRVEIGVNKAASPGSAYSARRMA